MARIAFHYLQTNVHVVTGKRGEYRIRLCFGGVRRRDGEGERERKVKTFENWETVQS